MKTNLVFFVFVFLFDRCPSYSDRLCMYMYVYVCLEKFKSSDRYRIYPVCLFFFEQQWVYIHICTMLPRIRFVGKLKSYTYIHIKDIIWLSLKYQKTLNPAEYLREEAIAALKRTLSLKVFCNYIDMIIYVEI